jgi:hypothetical protein
MIGIWTVGRSGRIQDPDFAGPNGQHPDPFPE